MVSAPKLFVYLDAVARAGSIRGAAETLNVASTAVNRMVIETERDLDTQLFERLPRGVRLTAAGELLIGAIRRNISDLVSVGSQIEQLRGLVRGKVTIVASESVADGLLPAVIANYQGYHPGVQFQVRVGSTPQLMESLMNYEADLLLAHDPLPTESLKEIVTIHQTLCVMMKPDHPLSSNSQLQLSDLQNYPLAIGDQSFFSRQIVDAAVRRSKISLRIALEANSPRTLIQFSRDTGAICFQWEIGTSRHVANGDFVCKRLADRDLPQSRLVLGSRLGRSLPIPALSFTEALRNRLLTESGKDSASRPQK